MQGWILAALPPLMFLLLLVLNRATRASCSSIPTSCFGTFGFEVSGRSGSARS